VGTFAVMLAMGFSLNNLTLFGLVLAIGIVVDDAIVVVEAVEHHIEGGLAPRAATIKAMSEVSAPVIAVGLVLSAVFIPCAFISGITGQFFRQFALTIASSTIISTFNSLTLSPALAAILVKPRRKGVYSALPWPAFLVLGGVAGYFWLGPYFLEHASRSQAIAATFAVQSLLDLLRTVGVAPQTAAGVGGALVGAIAGFALRRPVNWLLGSFFEQFNRAFRAIAGAYARLVGVLLRCFALVLFLYGGMLGLTFYGYAGFPKRVLNYIRSHEGLAKAAGLVQAPTPPGAQPENPGTLKQLLEFTGLPKGFIPSQDMGYLLVNIQLPDSASKERTEAVISKIAEIAKTPRFNQAVAATVGIAGQSLLLNASGSNFGTMFITLKDFKDRHDPVVDQIFRWLALDGSDVRKPRERALRRRLRLPDEKPSRYFEAVANDLRAEFSRTIHDADIAVFGPPPVRGVGRAGGFMIMIEDRGDLGPQALQEQVDNLVRQGRDPEVAHGQLVALTSVFRANVPQIYLDVNRSACMLKGVKLQDVFDTLQVYLGSLYVNDFNLFGRTWQVIAQAEAKYRDQKDDIRRLRVRNESGTMVPLGAVANVREINGPLVLSRYNMYPAASINGSAAPGVSTRTAIDLMSSLATQELPKAMAYEWTELAYLELQAGSTAMIVFAFSIAMVFLVLAAQFESWSMPLAVILSVPMCILSALAGVFVAKMDINIFTQIGLVVLVGLASKNSILIVEFAKVIHRTGKPIREATLESCRLRLRPIIMTSMAFILGVIPLLFSHGAGAEMRRSLGMAVFSGMLGVTLFGIVLTPVFFYIIDTLSESRFFASPTVRRVGEITLLLLTFGLVWLIVRAARLVTATPKPSGGQRDSEPHELVHSKPK
jgi:multidrug efflux pump